MAKGSGIQVSGVLVGILAIVAGVLILWGAISISLVIGIFLIVYGIIALIGKS
ncbi:MAG TPA: hypothetical protein VJ488_02550 [Dehalococcoidia bacterium]|jgi:uncharacterized membrane protein HdeD (DUF308 family)|nr:hypothetical protein [Dehalococcoidia bacterium]